MVLMRNSLIRLGSELAAKGPHKQEGTSRRVRTLFNGVYVADTTAAQHVWEHPSYPQYYVPLAAITSRSASNTGDVRLQKSKDVDGNGIAFLATLKVGQHSASTTDRVLLFEKGPLAGLVRLEFQSMGTLHRQSQRRARSVIEVVWLWLPADLMKMPG